MDKFNSNMYNFFVDMLINNINENLTKICPLINIENFTDGMISLYIYKSNQDLSIININEIFTSGIKILWANLKCSCQIENLKN